MLIAIIDKEHGWVLLFRDFGTDVEAPVFPYYILYNKYRGLIRFSFSIRSMIKPLHQVLCVYHIVFAIHVRLFLIVQIMPF